MYTHDPPCHTKAKSMNYAIERFKRSNSLLAMIFNSTIWSCIHRSFVHQLLRKSAPADAIPLIDCLTTMRLFATSEAFVIEISVWVYTPRKAPIQSFREEQPGHLDEGRSSSAVVSHASEVLDLSSHYQPLRQTGSTRLRSWIVIVCVLH